MKDDFDNVDDNLHPHFEVKGMIFSYDGESFKIFGITIFKRRKKQDEKISNDFDGSDADSNSGDELRR